MSVEVKCPWNPHNRSLISVINEINERYPGTVFLIDDQRSKDVRGLVVDDKGRANQRRREVETLRQNYSRRGDY